MHTFKVRSSQTKFNITTITAAGTPLQYFIQSFYQVLPNKWNINQQEDIGFAATAPDGTESDQTVNYFNVPHSLIGGGSWQAPGATSFTVDGINNTMSANYKAKLPFYASMLFPDAKLYNLHQVNTPGEALDLANLDTAGVHNFQKPFALDNALRTLYIYTTKDDNASRITFFKSPFETTPPAFDILYPKSGAAQFYVEYMAMDQNHYYHITKQFGETLSPSIDFLDNTYYALNKTGPTSFSVSFPKTPPSYYVTGFNGTNVQWFLYLPPGKNRFSGTDKFLDLSKTITAKSANYSSLNLGGLNIVNGDNMDYTSFFNFVFAVDAAGKNKFKLYQYF